MAPPQRTHPRRTHRLDHSADPGAAVAEAAALLRSGELVAIPTETVYGLAANALDLDAVRSVFAAKQRPTTDPLIVHVASADDVQPLVSEWPAAARSLASAFWPGPLTIVTRRHPSLSAELSAGLDTIAVRVPAHPVAEALLSTAGVPLAAPSANRFGRVSPTDADHVMDELDGRIAAVLDAGPTHLGVESTIVDVTGPVPRLLRPGGVTLELLQEALGRVDHVERSAVPAGVAAGAPGQLLAHYSPDTAVVLVDAGPGVTDTLVARLAQAGVESVTVDLGDDAAAAARHLYARLRDLDAGSARVALVTPLPPGGVGRAVNDRLFRAAHGRVVLDAGPESVKRLTELAATKARST